MDASETGTEDDLVCQECGKVYPPYSKDDYKNHIYRCRKLEKKFKCGSCDKAFVYKHSLVTHAKQHSDQPPMYICSVCRKNFTHKYSLLEHQKCHRPKDNDEASNKCPECGKVYIYKSSLTAHMQKHSKGIAAKCLGCQKLFQSSASWYGHRRNCKKYKKLLELKGEGHGGLASLSGAMKIRTPVFDTDKKSSINSNATASCVPIVHKCQLCEMSFTVRQHLNDHVDAVHDPFASSLQMSSVDNDVDVKPDIRKLKSVVESAETSNHNGVSQPNQDSCVAYGTGKNSRKEQSLLEVSPVNKTKDSDESKTRPTYYYICPCCAKTFNSLSVLKEHGRISHHLQVENKSFQQQVVVSKISQILLCPYCNKRFCPGRPLRMHVQRMHAHQIKRNTGEQSVFVTAADPGSVVSSTLHAYVQHMKYICRTCFLRFRTKFGLHSHEEIHRITGVRKCRYCARIFNRIANLKSHIKKCRVKMKAFVLEQKGKSSSIKIRNGIKGVHKRNMKSVEKGPVKSGFKIPYSKCVKVGENRVFICPTCSHTYKHYTDMKFHYLTSHTHKLMSWTTKAIQETDSTEDFQCFKCYHCDFVAKAAESVETHINEAHPVPDTKQKSSSRLRRSSWVASRRQRQRRLDQSDQIDALFCADCGMDFKSKGSLRLHRKILHWKERLKTVDVKDTKKVLVDGKKGKVDQDGAKNSAKKRKSGQETENVTKEYKSVSEVEQKTSSESHEASTKHSVPRTRQKWWSYDTSDGVRQKGKGRFQRLHCQCVICGLEFSWRSAYAQHVETIHKKQVRYKCGRCVKQKQKKMNTYDQFDDLVLHFEEFHGEQSCTEKDIVVQVSSSAPQTGKKSKDMSSVEKSKNRSSRTNITQKAISEKEKKIPDTNCNSSQLNVCSLCNKTFGRKASLKNHRKIFHNLDVDQTHSLDIDRDVSFKTNINVKKESDQTSAKKSNNGSVKNTIQAQQPEKNITKGVSGLNIPTTCPRKFKCADCMFVTEDLQMLVNHARKEHPVKTDQNQQKKTSVERSELLQSYHKCPYCELVFSHLENVKNHVLEHKDKELKKIDWEEHKLSAKQLMAHFKADRKVELVTCKMCEAVFSNMDVWKRHVLETHESNRKDGVQDEIDEFTDENDEILFQCPKCQKVLGNVKILRRHMREQHDQEILKTFDPNRHKITLKSLDGRKCKDGRYECTTCLKQFKHISLLYRHWSIEHALTVNRRGNGKCVTQCSRDQSEKNENGSSTQREDNNFSTDATDDVLVCGKCKLNFKNVTDFVNHKLAHHRNFVERSAPLVATDVKENESSATQTSKAKISDKYIASIKEGPDMCIKCHFCEYMCMRFCNLKRHFAIKHSSENFDMIDWENEWTAISSLSREDQLKISDHCTFPCPKCDEIFTHPVKLKAHREKVHKESIMKAVKTPQAFDIVSKTLGSDWDTGIEFTCVSKQCGERYDSVRASKFLLHKRSEHGEKLLLDCSQCDASFSTIGKIKRHIGISHSQDLMVTVKLKNTQLTKKDEVVEIVVCNACSVTFFSMESADAHDCIPEQTQYYCPYCDAFGDDIQKIQAHIKAKHEKLEVENGEPTIKMEYNDIRADDIAKDVAEDIEGVTATQMHETHGADVINTTLQTPEESSLQVLSNVGSELAVDKQRHYFIGGHRLVTQSKKEDQRSVGGHTINCRSCDKSFSDKKLLKYHMQFHLKSTVCVCGVCSKAFGILSQLKKHMEIHWGSSTVHGCKQCGKTFRFPCDLVRHQNTHSGERPFKCDHCGNRYCDLKAVRRHKREKHGEVGVDLTSLDHTEAIMCEKCGTIVKSQKSLHAHVVKEHMQTLHKCSICNLTFKSRRSYQHHMENGNHSRQPIDKYMLEMRRTDPRIAQSQDDLQEFKSVLRSLRTVDGSAERKFTCKLCGKQFNMAKKINGHMKRYHTSDQDKSFTCSICGKGFVRVLDLKIHVRIHSDIRPYTCRICLKKFKQLGHIREHMKCHTDKFNFPCRLCTKSLKTPSSLRAHVLNHCLQSPYKCPICPSQFFKAISALVKHCRGHYYSDSNQPEKIQCSMCPLQLGSMQEICRHLVFHGDDTVFHCEICQAKFSKYVDLYQHKDKECGFTQTELNNGRNGKVTNFPVKLSDSTVIVDDSWENIRNQYDTDEHLVDVLIGGDSASMKREVEVEMEEDEEVEYEVQEEVIEPEGEVGLNTLVDAVMNHHQQSARQTTTNKYAFKVVKSLGSDILLCIMEGEDEPNGPEPQVGQIFNPVSQNEAAFVVEDDITDVPGVTFLKTMQGSTTTELTTPGSQTVLVAHNQTEYQASVPVTVDHGVGYLIDPVTSSPDVSKPTQSSQTETGRNRTKADVGTVLVGQNERQLESGAVQHGVEEKMTISREKTIQSHIVNVTVPPVAVTELIPQTGEVRKVTEQLLNLTAEQKAIGAPPILTTDSAYTCSPNILTNLQTTDAKALSVIDGSSVHSNAADNSSVVYQQTVQEEGVKQADDNTDPGKITLVEQTDIQDIESLYQMQDKAVCIIDEADDPADFVTTAMIEKPQEGDKVINFSYKVNPNLLNRGDDTLKIFGCELCGKRFRIKKYLQSHTRSLHKPNSERAHQCCKCGKGFSRKQSLTAHERTHTGAKPFKCSECGKAFRQLGHLICHVRAHKDYRPYRCEVCKTRFVTGSQLRSHFLSHTGEKAYKCDICSKAYESESVLLRHRVSHTSKAKRDSIVKALRTGNDEEAAAISIAEATEQEDKQDHSMKKERKTYICDSCGKVFKSSYSFNLHNYRVHTTERNFPCTQCDRRLASKSLLREHMKIHQAMSPCPVCGKLIKNMATHIRVAHPKDETTYKCAKCKKVCNSKTQITNHVAVCCPNLFSNA